jgi:hypothetical protein
LQATPEVKDIMALLGKLKLMDGDAVATAVGDKGTSLPEHVDFIGCPVADNDSTGTTEVSHAAAAAVAPPATVVEPVPVKLKPKRPRYTAEQKAAILRLYSACGDRPYYTVKICHKVHGYSTFRLNTLKYWLQPRVAKQQGRPVNSEFEADVFSRLVVLALKPSESDPAVSSGTVDGSIILANAMYTHDIIRSAATAVQSSPKYCSDTKLAKMKFSTKWIRGFLSRARFSRKKASSAEKTDVIKDRDVIQERMCGIQHSIDRVARCPEMTFNLDETGVVLGEGPAYMFVPKDKAVGQNVRARSFGDDDKTRFTALMCGSGAGVMLPVFFIIACSVEGPDKTSARVIKSIHKTEGFTESDGWTLETWSRSFNQNGKPVPEPTSTSTFHSRPYLVHASGHVLTCQERAWNDAAGTAMWCDVLFAPYLQRLREKPGVVGSPVVVWDNASFHLTNEVMYVFKEHKIVTEELPANCTAFLQPMDLV